RAAATPAWLGRLEDYLAAAAATTALGVVVLGASVPALLTGFERLVVLALAAVVGVPLVLFGGYLIPRWLAQPRAERVAAAVVPLLRPWAAFLSMLLPARAHARPGDVRALWRERVAAGMTSDEELVAVSGVLGFARRPVREVMTPRTDVVAIPEGADLAEIRATFAQSGYSRIPVFRGTLDEIVGMVHAFDLFKLRPGDPLPVRPVAVAPASRTCGDLLLDMQRDRRHLAVVVDEFGGTAGIVTLEDLLEELVGEIFDEHDEGAAATPGPGPGVFETDGATPTAAIEERFGVKLPEGRATTIGGLLAELAGRIPSAGERLALGGLEFDVIQASPTRVERLLVRPAPVPVVTLKGAQ
ncbi:MAG TPA: hemolysin family protein, partial [Gemmatimonadales bacterium]|nr:hemolysin family protein [Gemmatimonadales bacterium]